MSLFTLRVVFPPLQISANVWQTEQNVSLSGNFSILSTHTTGGCNMHKIMCNSWFLMMFMFNKEEIYFTQRNISPSSYSCIRKISNLAETAVFIYFSANFI
jgi:hypothetical protein